MANETPKIILVDDDKDLLQLIAMRLTAAGYAVTAVQSGEAALTEAQADLAEATKPDADAAKEEDQP